MTGISVERRAELRALAGDTIECALAPDLAASGIVELLDDELDGYDEAVNADGEKITRLSARVAELEQQRETCGREEDHLAHKIPMTLVCPGSGEQVCKPDQYQHLGPWEHCPGSDSLNRCAACGTVIGK